MPYKDPEKNRAFQREWARARKQRLGDSEYKLFRERVNEYKRKYRAHGHEPRGNPKNWRRKLQIYKPRPKPQRPKEQIRYSAELNRMVIVLPDGTIKDCGFGKPKDQKPAPW
jgi:hypothetical protein